VIEKHLDFQIGDVLTQDKLVRAQKNLSDMQVFHQINIRPEETAEPGQYRLVVDLVEARHYELSYGIRYDTDTHVGGEMQIEDLNLLGLGHSISAYARADSTDQLYRLVYDSPALDSILPGVSWKTLVSASFEREELPTLLAKRIRATFQRQKNLWGPFVALGNYDFTRTSSRLLNSDSPFGEITLDVSRMIGTVLADTRDDPLNSTRGVLTSYEFEYAPKFLGSDLRFFKTYNQFFYFQRVRRILWASGVRFVFSSERFFAGGANTMRGFRLNEVGPRNLVGDPAGGEAVFIINQEIRFRLYKWFSGVVFYDGGNVYATAADFDPLKLRHSIGGGLRVDSPFGIGRLDVGINLDPQLDEPRYVLHLGIAQAF
jgi:outer membrane protein assembly factor BamA